MKTHIPNEFTALRARAKAKRDKGIAALKEEYERALVQIAALEQDLLGMRPTSYRKISVAVEQVIPREAEFTIKDVMASLEALDPRRVWRRRSVDWVVVGLRKKGLIRRIRRATIHDPAIYVRADSPIKASPMADTTLLQVVGRVLVRPMTATEVAVAVLEAGYKTAMSKSGLRVHVTRVLREGGFRNVGGKWEP